MSSFNKGTPYYVAPEVLTHQQASRASDVYAMGIIMWEMYTGLTPWLYSHSSGYTRHPLLQLWPPTAPPAYSSLAAQCMETDPAARPSFDFIAEQIGSWSRQLEAEATSSTTTPPPPSQSLTRPLAADVGGPLSVDPVPASHQQLPSSTAPPSSNLPGVRSSAESPGQRQEQGRGSPLPHLDSDATRSADFYSACAGEVADSSSTERAMFHSALSSTPHSASHVHGPPLRWDSSRHESPRPTNYLAVGRSSLPLPPPMQLRQLAAVGGSMDRHAPASSWGQACMMHRRRMEGLSADVAGGVPGGLVGVQEGELSGPCAVAKGGAHAVLDLGLGEASAVPWEADQDPVGQPILTSGHVANLLEALEAKLLEGAEPKGCVSGRV